MQAVTQTVVRMHGDCAPRAAPVRGGLAPWQERRAKEMIQAGLAGNVALTDIADACSLSVAHFARAFRQSVGTSPYRWLRQRRIDRAMELLSRTPLPLTQIAIACGFSDQSHFTRTFTALAGISPGQWRRRKRR